MSSIAIRFALSCVRGWTWLYTWRMPRRLVRLGAREIDSDLWEFQCDAPGDQGLGSALHVVLRLVLGMPDDLGWRIEQAASPPRPPRASIALSGRVDGAVLCICAHLGD